MTSCLVSAFTFGPRPEAYPVLDGYRDGRKEGCDRGEERRRRILALFPCIPRASQDNLARKSTSISFNEVIYLTRPLRRFGTRVFQREISDFWRQELSISTSVPAPRLIRPAPCLYSCHLLSSRVFLLSVVSRPRDTSCFLGGSTCGETAVCSSAARWFSSKCARK